MDWNVGDIVEGKITGISAFGAFVEIAPEKSGLVHISEIASGYVSNINDIYSVGDIVKAKVISVENNKISLSIKQLEAPSHAKPPKAPSEKKKFPPRQKYQSPGRPGDAAWEATSYDNNMSFEDKLNKFKMASDEKLGDLKRKNGNDGKRRGKKGMAPII